MDTPPPLEPLPEDWTRALAVVAHPDDMEFGSAAAVARWTGQGKEVVYCMVTSGEAGIDSMEPDECRRVREAEEIESARIVGVSTVEFLHQPDGDPRVRPAAAARDLRRRPQAPAGDRDHRHLRRPVGRPDPQPGRPHRHRAGGPRRRARRRQPLGVPRPARRRRSSRGAACDRCGPAARTPRGTASTPPTPSTPVSTRSLPTRPTSTGSAGRTGTRASSSRGSAGRPGSGWASPSPPRSRSIPMTWEQD